MNKKVHAIYIGSMTAVTVLVTGYLTYVGFDYYKIPLEERFYDASHEWFKPSGAFGHALGITGTLMILFGVSIYIARKRYNFMKNYLKLKYLLEFHIFLCILGPILILFHTAFKFGGIVSIAFWSMVVVVLSGVIGRFIYIQIPRTIEGRELSLIEVKSMQSDLSESLKNKEGMDAEMLSLIGEFISGGSESTGSSYFKKYLNDRKTIGLVRKKLKQKNIDKAEQKLLVKMVKDEISLSNRIVRLKTMQRLFKYWHVAHLPFALIMLIVLIIHVGVTLAFGYKWIF